MSARARQFISRHIDHHIRDLGMSRAQAARVAYDEARREGFKVPAPRNPRGGGEWMPKTVVAFALKHKLPLRRDSTGYFHSGDLVSMGTSAKSGLAVLRKALRARKSSGGSNPRRGKKRNPRDVVIGDQALSLTYRGGQGKRKNKQPWKHDFDSKVQILGQKDGSVLLKSEDGLPLWDYF